MIATTRAIHELDASRWVWPLPDLELATPTVIERCDCHVHLGYADHEPAHRIPVFAACDGLVTYARATTGGHIVCVDHPCGWSTQYAGLDDIILAPTDRSARRRKQRVRAGDVIGHIRCTPLRFTLVQLVDHDELAAIDPIPHLARWDILPWTNPHASLPATG